MDERKFYSPTHSILKVWVLSWAVTMPLKSQRIVSFLLINAGCKHCDLWCHLIGFLSMLLMWRFPGTQKDVAGQTKTVLVQVWYCHCNLWSNWISSLATLQSRNDSLWRIRRSNNSKWKYFIFVQLMRPSIIWHLSPLKFSPNTDVCWNSRCHIRGSASVIDPNSLLSTFYCLFTHLQGSCLFCKLFSF